MLAMKGQHRAAAQMIVEQVGAPEEEYAQLGEEERRLLGMAATYFQKAGDSPMSASIFEALGEAERAAHSRAHPASQLLVPEGARQGPGPEAPSPVPAEASLVSPHPPPAIHVAGSDVDSVAHLPPADAVARARNLIRAGSDAEAAGALSSAGLNYEAGVVLLKAGAIDQALAELRRVPLGSSQYRAAARTVIRVMIRIQRCQSFDVEFIGPLLQSGPSEPSELPLFYQASTLMARQGFGDAALRALEAVERAHPGQPETQARLEKLRRRLPSDRSGHNPTATSAGGPVPPAPPLGTDPAGSEFRPVRSTHVRVSSIPPATIPTPHFSPGMVVGDRFRLDEQIGEGGMATVFAARDLELDEEVALKVFSGQLVTQSSLQDAVQRFRQELKLCRKLNHPNIIKVYDIGIHAGLRYFTMERLRGQTLDALLGSPMSPGVSVPYLMQICEGLHSAHEKGVVHRDVKPENLFICADGVVKIMDFGIARSSKVMPKTAVGTIGGTAEYMAPEQINNFSEAGPAADQYSLGIVAYEMLTGSVPFVHSQLMPLLMMHLNDRVAPLSDLVPEVPPELEAIVLRMLAKHPSERFESCLAVWEHLAALGI